MLSIRAPHVPAIVPSRRRAAIVARTGADMTAPSLPFLYGIVAAAGAVIGGVAYLGSTLVESHPLLGSLAGGAVGGVAAFGAVVFVSSGGLGPQPRPAT